MQCLSCKLAMTSMQAKIFNTILVCTSCYAMAEKADIEISVHIDRARQMSRNWLEQFILQGGLLHGGSGNVSDRFQIHIPASVQGVQSEDGPQDGSIPTPGRD